MRIQLQSGRSFDANLGILGLGPDGDELYEGYDGEVMVFDASGEDVVPLTPEERAELALHMISRWKKWGGV